MRKKGLVILVLTMLMSIACVFSSYAGEWKQDTVGWWYQNADSSYLSNGWYWINGRCYYFDSNGYCLQNTVTPDGYTVDASGAWTVNGVVQTRQTYINLKTIQVQIPNGYYATVGEDFTTLYETNNDEYSAALVMEHVDDLYTNYGEESYASLSEELINSLATDVSGYTIRLVSKGVNTYANRNWYYFNYIYTSSDGFEIPSYYYISFADNSCTVIIIDEAREFLNGEYFVKNYIK